MVFDGCVCEGCRNRQHKCMMVPCDKIMYTLSGGKINKNIKEKTDRKT